MLVGLLVAQTMEYLVVIQYLTQLHPLVEVAVLEVLEPELLVYLAVQAVVVLPHFQEGQEIHHLHPLLKAITVAMETMLLLTMVLAAVAVHLP